MNDDRAVKHNKETAYAKSILFNAIRLGGQKEALKAREDLNSILEVAIRNVAVFDHIENYVETVLKNNLKDQDPKHYIRSVFKGASEAVMDTLYTMAENKDMILLIGMLNAYNILFEQTYDQVIVDVTTVVELDDKLRNLIEEKAKKDLGQDVVLNEKINKNIIGGVIITAQNKTLDCSLFRTIMDARNELTSVHQNS